MSLVFVCQIDNHFANVTDPRVNRGKNFPLNEMIFVALCGAICDANTWVDVAEFGQSKLAWFRKFLPFEQGIPSHDTFTEIFARLDTIEFYAALQSWTGSVAQSLKDRLKGETVAFDGKALRNSFDAESGKSALHSVSAWACGLRLCLGLTSVADESNEIPAVQQLIDLMELKGAVVTADAMHCQRETAAKIIAQEADYVLLVKGNQETLEDAIELSMIESFETDDPQLRQCHKAETNRDRQETRSVAARPVPKDSKIFARWPGAKTIGGIYRTREIDGRMEDAQVYFITSLPCKVRAIAKHLRAHWGIENSQYYVLDVTFTEDASRIRKGNGPEISSVFRRLALNILQQDTSMKKSIRVKRKRCGWDEEAFERLLAGFSGV